MKRLLPLAFACLALGAAIAAPMAGAKSSKSSSRVSVADEQYLKTALAGDLFEINGGQLALAKSNDPAVIRLANRLIADHRKSFIDDAKLARKLGVEIPKSPMPSMVWDLRMVASLRGKAFNHWYSSLEVYDHLQDIQEATDEVEDGTNSKVRDSARTELPTLRVHLALARGALRANP